MSKKSPKILVLGSSGMLGHVVFDVLSKKYETWGTARTKCPQIFKNNDHIIEHVDATDLQEIKKHIENINPTIVINCIGIIKQSQEIASKALSIQINALFPHQLAQICSTSKCDLIHFSTDCVFSGKRGQYRESDELDATDFYGKTKALGELDYGHTLTLRTSIIGHELNSARSLVGWFLSQKGSVRGFSRAMFSGFPTITLANILSELIQDQIPKGIYHISTSSISKYQLLRLIAERYNHPIEIVADEVLVLDRSLDSSKLNSLINWPQKSWKQLVNDMYEHYKRLDYYL